ncbi:MAG: hypothetical protein Q8R43_02115, partial [Alphaproteobacteria bacterium]|nr:hypothetical protein [Alphaproteobacteria bacterium]
MVFIYGTLTTAPGVDVHTRDGVTFKFIRENGLRGDFITSPLTMRAKDTHPIVLALLRSGVFRIGSATTDLSAFLMLPSTPIEDKEFEAAFLEELMHDSDKEDNPFKQVFISNYLATAEDEPAAPVTAAAPIAPEAPEIILKKYIDSLYEERIFAEQAEISRKVAKALSQEKSKLLKKVRQSTSPQSPCLPDRRLIQKKKKKKP